MGKSKKRQEIRSKKLARKAAGMKGGGASKYAKKHRGGGNTGPNGMWIKVEA